MIQIPTEKIESARHCAESLETTAVIYAGRECASANYSARGQWSVMRSGPHYPEWPHVVAARVDQLGNVTVSKGFTQ